jgi:5-methylcytosine-specific restriction endonuclease McrA
VEGVFSFHERNISEYSHQIDVRDDGPPSLGGRVLILNQSYEPITVCSARKAMILLVLMKADLVEIDKDRAIRSVSRVFPYPSVIRLATFVRFAHRKVELSRKNLHKRDGHKCQYCGKKNIELTIDHIIPKSRGGADTWENLVSACVACNNKKGSRTPEEASMTLLTKPSRPHHILFMKQYLGKVDNTWKPFLFME